MIIQYITYLKSIPEKAFVCQVLNASNPTSNVISCILFLCFYMTICSFKSCSFKFTYIFFSLCISNKSFGTRFDIRIIGHYSTLFNLIQFKLKFQYSHTPTINCLASVWYASAEKTNIERLLPINFIDEADRHNSVLQKIKVNYEGNVFTSFPLYIR